MASMVWDPVAGRYKPVDSGPTSAMTVAPGGGGPLTRYPPGGGVVGPPGGDIYQQAWGLINPQLQAAADAINRRSYYGSNAITDLTGVYGQRMSAASGMDVFGPEKKFLGGAADWGKSNLVQSGREQAAGLAQAAAQAGPGLTAGRDLDLAKEGKGAGGAAYGTGISWLDAQVAKATAAASRAALEPSFAAGMGQMQQGILANNLARQLADQQSQITAQIPDLIDRLTERRYQHEQDIRDYQLRLKESQTTTKQNRLTQLMNLKDRAEASTGYQYVITSTGIKPRLVKGQKVPTLEVSAQKRKDQLDVILATHIDASGNIDAEGQKWLREHGYPAGAGGSAKTYATNVASATQLAKAQQTHQDAMAKLKVAQQNANTAAGRAAVAAATARENIRYKEWQIANGIGVSKKNQAGSAPRLARLPGGGTEWRRAGGAKLTNPYAVAYWNGLYREGFVNARGKMLRVVPPGWVPKKVDYPAGAAPGGSSSQPPSMGS